MSISLCCIKLISVLTSVTYIWPHISIMTSKEWESFCFSDNFFSVVGCNIILFTFLSISPHFLNCCIHCYTKAYGWNRLMFLFLFYSTDGLFEKSLIPDKRSCIIRRYWGPWLPCLPFSLLEVISTTVGKVLRSRNRPSMKHQQKCVGSRIQNKLFVWVCMHKYHLSSTEIDKKLLQFFFSFARIL